MVSKYKGFVRSFWKALFEDVTKRFGGRANSGHTAELFVGRFEILVGCGVHDLTCRWDWLEKAEVVHVITSSFEVPPF